MDVDFVPHRALDYVLHCCKLANLLMDVNPFSVFHIQKTNYRSNLESGGIFNKLRQAYKA